MSCRTNRLLLTHWFPASSAEKCVWRQNSWVLLTGGAVWTSLWLSSNGPRCDRETGDLIGHRAGGTAHPLGLWAIFERVYNYLKSFFATTPYTLFRMTLDWRLCRKMQVFWLCAQLGRAECLQKRRGVSSSHHLHHACLGFRCLPMGLTH